MFADSHVHLDRYTDEEIAALLLRARQRGVTRFLTVGVDLASSERAVLLARQHTNVFAAVGLHPMYVQESFGAERVRYHERLQALAQGAPEVVAIGEAGIDLLDAQAKLDVQRAAFRLQLHLAYDLKLPLILHNQKADAHCQELLQEVGRERGQAAMFIVHYFVGDLACAARWLDLGGMLSVGRPVARPENIALRAAVASIPLERLLLETDTYPLPGRDTEPAHLAEMAQAVAEIKRLPIEKVAEQTTANFCRLLRISDA
ncbi:MAG TPA: TatD family hydrolase [Ktedonobacterales bacterium]|jgi:TatD DNase family protein